MFLFITLSVVLFVVEVFSSTRPDIQSQTLMITLKLLTLEGRDPEVEYSGRQAYLFTRK